MSYNLNTMKCIVSYKDLGRWTKNTKTDNKQIIHIQMQYYCDNITSKAILEEKERCL